MPVATDLLADLPLLRGLTSVELEEMASHLEASEAGARETLVKEGDAPEHPIFLLLAGNVEIVKHGLDRRDHCISTLAAPSVFGEIEVLSHRPAIASVITRSPVKLALLNRGVFDELCESNRSCVLKLVRNLAATLAYRLAATDGRLAAYFSASLQDTDALGQVQGTLYAGWEARSD